MPDQKHCPSCGYTKEDAQIQGDHRLCKNAGNAPWEREYEPRRKARCSHGQLYLANWKGGDKGWLCGDCKQFVEVDLKDYVVVMTAIRRTV